MKRLFILTLILCFASINMSFAGTFKADAKTKRIAAGTQFELVFTQPVSTSANYDGDSFAAILKNELKTENNTVILPQGSVVRGCIKEIKTTISKNATFFQNDSILISFRINCTANKESTF